MTPALRELLGSRCPSDPPETPFPIDADPPQKKEAIRIICWVDSYLERRIWDREAIRERIMARSPEAILRDGHICFAAPCFDLASVTAEILKGRGFAPTIVVSRMKRFLQPTGLQVGIEVALDGRPHVIGFGASSKRLYEGRYDIIGPRRLVHRRPVQGETWRTSHLALFGIGSYFELPTLLPGYSPRRQIARFQRMMRPSRLRRARHRAILKARERRPGHIPSVGRWADTP